MGSATPYTGSPSWAPSCLRAPSYGRTASRVRCRRRRRHSLMRWSYGTRSSDPAMAHLWVGPRRASEQPGCTPVAVVLFRWTQGAPIYHLICQGMSWQHLNQPWGWIGVILLSLPLSLSLSARLAEADVISLQQFAWPEALQSVIIALQWTIVTMFRTNVTIYHHLISQAGWNRCNLLSIYPTAPSRGGAGIVDRYIYFIYTHVVYIALLTHILHPWHQP